MAAPTAHRCSCWRSLWETHGPRMPGIPILLQTVNRTRIWVGLTYRLPVKHFILQPPESAVYLAYKCEKEAVSYMILAAVRRCCHEMVYKNRKARRCRDDRQSRCVHAASGILGQLTMKGIDHGSEYACNRRTRGSAVGSFAGVAGRLLA